MTKSITATEARKNFFLLLEKAEKPGMIVTITHQGHSPVIMMSLDEFEGWQETMEIMADPELMKDIREGMKEKGGIPLEELELWEHAGKRVQGHPQAKGKKAVRQSSAQRPAKSSRRTARTA